MEIKTPVLCSKSLKWRRNWKSSSRSRDTNYKPKLCQNAALPLNGVHLNNPSTECWKFCWAATARARPGWAVLMRGLSLLGQSSRYRAMMTRPVLTKLLKAWSIIIVLIPAYDILISSQSRHSSAPNWHACIELLISLHYDRHLFVDGFVTVGQSPWHLVEIKKAYQVWSLENFTPIRQNFSR